MGHVDAASRTSVVGWASYLDDSETNVEVSVSVVVNGVSYVQTVTTEARDDLIPLIGRERASRCGFTVNFAPMLSIYSDNMIEVRMGIHGEPLSNGNVLIRRVASLGQSWATPILVASPGRSGSSLFMAMLKNLRGVTVAAEHPYEVRLCSHSANALNVLLTGSEHGRSTHPDKTSGDSNPFWFGLNPFDHPQYGSGPNLRQYWQDVYPRRTLEWARDTITDYYSAVAASRGLEPLSLFAEKAFTDRLAKSACKSMFGKVIEFVLIRDPRDLVCSYQSFWKTEFEEVLDQVDSQIKQLTTMRLSSDVDTVFIKYETLITQYEVVHLLVQDCLGSKPRSDAKVLDVVPSAHMTSNDPSSSIGRWKTDMTGLMSQKCNSIFADFIQLFKY